MAADSSLLRTEHISKSYDGRMIIEDISIRLEKGELVSLLGLSGSGKTTLFQVISGLVRPDSGRVMLSGEDITEKPGKVSYMLQKDLLLPHKKIIDNAALPLVIRGAKKADARRTAAPYFAQFGLAGTEYQYPSQLSGGMRQRAALLRTYLGSEGVALLDEPFSALDMITKGQMHDWYLDIMSRIDLSTIFITHDIDEALMLSDRVYIMTGSPGRIDDEIRISVKRNERKDFSLTEEFLEYKKKILNILKQ
ncbi:MAG: ABC transporter ATP-binding protein [Blautia sp.]|nr:ABC transporter ATP-binding protein [Blautia sp.]